MLSTKKRHHRIIVRFVTTPDTASSMDVFHEIVQCTNLLYKDLLISFCYTLCRLHAVLLQLRYHSFYRW